MRWADVIQSDVDSDDMHTNNMQQIETDETTGLERNNVICVFIIFYTCNNPRLLLHYNDNSYKQARQQAASFSFSQRNMKYYICIRISDIPITVGAHIFGRPSVLKKNNLAKYPETCSNFRICILQCMIDMIPYFKILHIII